MRVFIAIDIEPHILKGIGALQKELRGNLRQSRGIKWVRPELIHLTLKFLGEVGDDSICEVCEIVRHAAECHQAFSINVDGIGVFGRPARVLWMGTDTPVELAELQADIEMGLVEAGWPADRKKYSAHLTMARIKNTKAAIDVSKLVDGYEMAKIGSFFADSVCIYKSELTSDGPEYTLLSRTKLQ